MQTFIAICGFIGAWLLVAGSVYQAALELREESFEEDHIESIRQTIGTPPQTSTWWWLLPPVMLYLARKRGKAYRQKFMHALPNEDVESMITFINKATGWLLVATGGLLLAVKETYELVELQEWRLFWFWIISIVVAVVCVSNTAYRISRSERLITHK